MRDREGQWEDEVEVEKGRGVERVRQGQAEKGTGAERDRETGR